MEDRQENVSEVQMVIFKLDREEFAVDIYQVREVLNKTQITPLPRSPHYIEGVINLRGEVIPVIDLRKRFGLPELDSGERARVVIVEIQNNNVGLTVDSVTEVLRYSAGAIQQPPSRGSGSRTDFIKGIAKLEERLLTILNLEKILTSDEVITMEEVTVSGN